jgi:hypothetical protein
MWCNFNADGNGVVQTDEHSYIEFLVYVNDTLEVLVLYIRQA